jgi:hypothetical protein
MMKKTGGAKKPINMKSGKMPMVKGKDGNMIPAFAADGKGKMAGGGATKKTKAMAKGGVTKMSEGKRTRRPAPTEKPASKDVLINAIEEDRRIAEANKTAKKRGGGAMKKTKGYSKGGAMKKTKGYSAGGVARGTGAATRGKKFSRSM